MLVSLATSILGIIAFLFIFWKRLKDDYASPIIFTASFYILLGIAAGWGMGVRFLGPWFLWLSVAGSILGLLVSVFRLKMRFYETFESMIIAGLPWTAFAFLKDSVTGSSLSSFIAFLIVLVFIYAFYYLDTHFREFTWYRSGKIGFAGLSTLVLIFLTRFIASLFGVSVLSLTGRFEPIASGVAAFVCLALLYNLSRKKV